MARNTPDIHCNGCGKAILDKEDGVRVAQGKVVDGDFEEKKEWGVMHRACFNKSIDHPDNVYAALKEEAKRQSRGR